jgi:hypothetical protein
MSVKIKTFMSVAREPDPIAIPSVESLHARYNSVGAGDDPDMPAIASPNTTCRGIMPATKTVIPQTPIQFIRPPSPEVPTASSPTLASSTSKTTVHKEAVTARVFERLAQSTSNSWVPDVERSLLITRPSWSKANEFMCEELDLLRRQLAHSEKRNTELLELMTRMHASQHEARSSLENRLTQLQMDVQRMGSVVSSIANGASEKSPFGSPGGPKSAFKQYSVDAHPFTLEGAASSSPVMTTALPSRTSSTLSTPDLRRMHLHPILPSSQETISRSSSESSKESLDTALPRVFDNLPRTSTNAQVKRNGSGAADLSRYWRVDAVTTSAVQPIAASEQQQGSSKFDRSAFSDTGRRVSECGV